jgi:hypothetical protein
MAETVSPYSAGFDDGLIKPYGWNHPTTSSYGAATYTAYEEGGHSGGYITVKQSYNYCYNTSAYKGYSYNDILVTPKVSGTVTLWVKNAGINTDDPSLTFCDIADGQTVPTYNNTTLIDGTDINMVADMDLTDWTEITVTLDEPTYIGIRAHNLAIDDFSATSAEVVPLVKMSFSAKHTTGISETQTSASSSLNADENNMVTITFDVTVSNEGDEDFTPAGDGIKVVLKNYSQEAVCDSVYITETIPAGTTLTKSYSMTFEPVVPNTSYVSSSSYRLYISNELLPTEYEESLAYLSITPYAPKATFMLDEANAANATSYTSVGITDQITIGMGAAGTSRTLCMWNQGTAPMDATIEMEGDFDCDVESFSIEPDAKKNITISLKGDPGRKEGKISFSDSRLGTVSYDLLGLITEEGKYLEDFEEEGDPVGYIIGTDWSKKTTDQLSLLGGEKLMEHYNYYSTGDLISPKISFADGEGLNFMGASTNSYSSTLDVYYSSDRVNWTQTNAITTSSYADPDKRFSLDKPTGTGYNNFEYKLFKAAVPDGEYYVKFTGKNARVDNVYGGQLVDVAHDLYVTDTSLPEAGYVNTRYLAKISMKNLSANPETDYDVVLVVDGEDVASADETPDLIAGAETATTYSMQFTPHQDGTFPAQFVFVSGEDRVVLSEFNVEIKPEQSSVEYQIGTQKTTSSDPFNVRYSGSQCQILYSADMLGMDDGAKITGVMFKGYSPYAASFTKHIKVWAQNTEDTNYDSENVVPESTDNMTLVYEGDYTFTQCGDYYSNNFVPIMDCTFPEPFTYTGQSVRLMVETRSADDDDPNRNNVFFCIDNSAYSYYYDLFDNRVIKQTKAYAEDLDDPDEQAWYMYEYGYPVTYFAVSKDVVNLTGSVKDEFNQPVSGATVKLTSDDLIYSAISDEEGAYSMDIISINSTFSRTVEAEGFTAQTEDEVTFSAEELNPVKDFVLAFVDRTATLSGVVTNTLNENAPVADVTVVVSNGTDEVSATTDEEGKYSVTVPEFAGTFSVSVVREEATIFTKADYQFASKADELNLEVAFEPEYEFTVSGYVSDEFYNELPGATVTVKADEAIQSATTDEEGGYTISFVGTARTYTIEFAAEGFESESLEVTLSADKRAAYEQDAVLRFTDRTATLSGVVTNSMTNAGFEGVNVQLLKNGAVVAEATTDADGQYSLTAPDFSGIYALSVDYNGTVLYEEESYMFASKSVTLNISVAYSGLASLMGADGVSVKVANQVITVVAPAGTNVSLFNSTGMLLGKNVSKGNAAIKFGPLTPGVYFVAGHKVLVK